MPIDPAKLSRFTTDNLGTVRECLAEALAAPVFAGLGITVKIGKITYSDKRFTVSLEALLDGALDADQQRYDQMRQYRIEAMPPRGWEFVLRGRKFAVYGQTRGRKVIATESATGKQYTYRVADIEKIYAKFVEAALKEAK